MVTLSRTLASLALPLLALTSATAAQDAGQHAGQDAGRAGTRLLHAPAPGSEQAYEVLTSFRNETHETVQWRDGTKIPGRVTVTGVALEQTLRLLERFPGGEVVLRRELLGLEHLFTVTRTGGSRERTSLARGWWAFTGRKLELRRVAGGPPTWRLPPQSDPTDDPQGVTPGQAPDHELPDAVLAGLPRAPLLTGLLPKGPVEEGERWELSATSALSALLPVGDLPVSLRHESGDHPPIDYGWFVTLAAAMDGDVAGECSAELLRLEERDGRHVAVIGLELSLEVVADLVPHFRRQGADYPQAGSEWGFEGRGELIWDLGASRAVECALSGQVRQLLDFRWDETNEARQLVSGRLAVRVRETRR